MFKDLQRKKRIASPNKIGFGKGAMDPTLKNTTHWETVMTKLDQRFILIKNTESHLKESYKWEEQQPSLSTLTNYPPPPQKRTSTPTTTCTALGQNSRKEQLSETQLINYMVLTTSKPTCTTSQCLSASALAPTPSSHRVE